MSIEIPRTLFQLAAGRNSSLAWYYGVGVVLNQITPRNRFAAGDEMKQIADEVFGNRQVIPTLYACRRFARTFRASDLELLQGLSWKHVIYLTSVKRRRMREAFVRLAKSDGLSARRLKLAIQERCGKRTKGGPRTRPEYLPPKAACRETKRACDDLMTRLPVWLRSVSHAELVCADPERESLIASTRMSLRAAQRMIRDELRRL